MKLCVENRYLWDFLKFETLRQELDANISNQHRWVLYDNKEVPQEIARNMGLLAGLTSECVNQGTKREGLEVEEGEHESHEDKDWSIEADQIYMSGRLSEENLQSIIDMKQDENVTNALLFPGMSVAYLQEKDAFNVFSDEYRSRQNLYNVCFAIKMDTREGMPNFVAQ